MPDSPEDDAAVEAEPSLEQLSRAFAEAMGRGGLDKAPDNADLDANQSSDGLREQSSTGQPDDDVDDESDADDACPISPRSVLEAILFVGHPDNEPITSGTVAGLLRGVEPAEVDELVVALNDGYAEHDLPLHIESVGAGYRLQLNADLDHVRQRFYGRIREARLSQAAIDVLAIVAYNQPITRKRVDELCGDRNGRVLSQLVRRRLLTRTVSSDAPGKKQYVTTDRFLTLFGLQSLDDLPRSDDPQ